MRKSTISLLIIFLKAFFIISCNTNSNPVNSEQDSFLFKVIVKNSEGNALPNIRVAAWNFIQTPNGPIIGKRNISITATTSIRVAIENNANVSMNVYDLNDNFISNIVNSYLEKGNYEFNWSVDDLSPVRFFKCKIVATDSISSNILFTDSIYMTLYQPDFDRCFIGWTDSEGVYQTEDQLLFPSTLQNFIKLKYVNWDPFINDYDSSRTFYFIDSIRIVLTDTITGKQNIYKDFIGSNKNVYNITWHEPDAIKDNDHIQPQFILESLLKSDENWTIKNNNWKLFQNFPNPFN